MIWGYHYFWKHPCVLIFTCIRIIFKRIEMVICCFGVRYMLQILRRSQEHSYLLHHVQNQTEIELLLTVNKKSCISEYYKFHILCSWWFHHINSWIRFFYIRWFQVPYRRTKIWSCVREDPGEIFEVCRLLLLVLVIREVFPNYLLVIQSLPNTISKHAQCEKFLKTHSFPMKNFHHSENSPNVLFPSLGLKVGWPGTPGQERPWHSWFQPLRFEGI